VPTQDDDDYLEPFHMLENATRDNPHIITKCLRGWLVRCDDDEIIPKKKKLKYIFSGRSSVCNLQQFVISEEMSYSRFSGTRSRSVSAIINRI